MKLKSNLLIAISIFLFVSFGYSQAPPGYLGKKTTIGFGFGVPTYAAAKKIDKAELAAMDGRSVNSERGRVPTYSIELSRTISRHRSLSLIYSRAQVGVDVDFRADFGFDEYGIEGFINANISSIGLLYNSHSKVKGHLSPFGGSYIIGIKHSTIKASSMNLYSSFFEVEQAKDLDLNKAIRSTTLSIGWSHTILIKDMLFIKPRVLASGNIGTIKYLSSSYDVYSIGLGQEAYEHEMKSRVISQELIQIEISAGIIF